MSHCTSLVLTFAIWDCYLCMCVCMCVSPAILGVPKGKNHVLFASVSLASRVAPYGHTELSPNSVHAWTEKLESPSVRPWSWVIAIQVSAVLSTPRIQAVLAKSIATTHLGAENFFPALSETLHPSMNQGLWFLITSSLDLIWQLMKMVYAMICPENQWQILIPPFSPWPENNPCLILLWEKEPDAYLMLYVKSKKIGFRV